MILTKALFILSAAAIVGCSSPSNDPPPTKGGGNTPPVETGGNPPDGGANIEHSRIHAIITVQDLADATEVVNLLPVVDDSPLTTNSTALDPQDDGEIAATNTPTVGEMIYDPADLSITAIDTTTETVGYFDGLANYVLNVVDTLLDFATRSPYIEYEENKQTLLTKIESKVILGSSTVGAYYYHTPVKLGDSYYFIGHKSGAISLFRMLPSGVIEKIAENLKTEKMVSHDGYLYFRRRSSLGFDRLYKTDGEVVTRVSDISASSDNISKIHASKGGKLYFVLNTSSNLKLYTVNSNNIRLVSDLNPGLSDSPEFIGDLGDMSYYALKEAGGLSARGIYRTDGSSLVKISNLFLNPTYPSAVHNGELYFTGHYNTEKNKLYKTDGTTVTKAFDIFVGDHDIVQYMVSTDAGLYMTVRDDGTTPAKIYLLSDSEVNLMSETVVVENLKTLNGVVYFVGLDKKLYRLINNIQEQVTDIHDGVADFSNRTLDSYNGALYGRVHMSPSADIRLARITDNTVSIVSDTNIDQNDSIVKITETEDGLFFESVIDGKSRVMFLSH